MEKKENQEESAQEKYGKYDLLILRAIKKNTKIKIINKNMIIYKDPNDEINEQLIQACKDGDLERVKYLLTSPELKNHADINYKDGDAFTEACENEHIRIIKYLLTSPEIKDSLDFNAYSGLGFAIACEKNNLELIKYLLTSSELQKHADIHTYENYALKEICKRGHLEALEYLTTSNDIPTRFENKDWSIGFFEACQQNQHHIVRYFIFNLDYEISEEDLEKLPEEVKNMFALRKLNKKLNNELKINKEENNKIIKV